MRCCPSVRRSGWLLLPLWLTYAFDITMTLAGQPAAYWQGNYQSAIEANPLAAFLLHLGPMVFLGLAILWICAITMLVVSWRSWVTNWLAIGLTVGHALGGSSWFLRIGPWGILGSIAFLYLTSTIAGRYWSQAKPMASPP